MIAIRTALRSIGQTGAVKKLKSFHRTAFSDKYLLITNVTISLSLSTTGDVIEQQYEKYSGELEKWDKRRSMNMGLSGVSVGVICHYWYKFLDRRMPGRGLRTVVQKIALDQFICSPVYISAFFVTLGVLEKKTRQEVWEEMKEKAWKLYAAEWAIWPPAQFVNFYWLPTKYRVFYDNIISLGYDIYASQVIHDTS
ncbi:mpv17-like protein 2 [Eupeodes corollae]|uniref:mpv17-like protein 2 n=1 Tax=Eupeodes corollae TaxID=290404 RepID=UPI0024939343|nr:mpv17-like protein 2 [Eupeodes corollae]